MVRRSPRLAAADVAVAPSLEPLFRIKFELQIQRDAINNRISKRWKTHTPVRRSRGINNPNNYCYMNSTLQALMHQPSFLNWILTHRSARSSRANVVRNDCKNPVDCAGCALKGLVQRYSAGHFLPNVVPGAIAFPRDIERIAINRGMYLANTQDDSAELYQFLLREVKKATDKRVFPMWRREFHALFSLDTTVNVTCNACNQERFSSTRREQGMVLSVSNHNSTWNNVLDGYFREDVNNLTCPTCNAQTNQVARSKIVAAPQILKIRLSIFNWVPPSAPGIQGQMLKVHHHVHYPDILNLQNRQLHDHLPLRYRLSSVISHAGADINSGHYIASARGPRDDQDIRCISDSNTEQFKQSQLLQSPQRPTQVSHSVLEAYVLTYIKQDVPLTRQQRKIEALVSDMV
ncbi:cysteine proteinase [Plenodomus tracheiphilus IPT5]|uniref:ubiquitinyl hydrolase 1 n=1 Tax=Plenodomus tracheiphilus IPT5 TaxID=1408161 RepID=A0A6A7BI45_9PLEO|nr:cysteine proteinase [Plenodomus tracheiphilus IPT5]